MIKTSQDGTKIELEGACYSEINFECQIKKSLISHA